MLWLVPFALLLLGGSCGRKGSEPSAREGLSTLPTEALSAMRESVTLTTSDNARIAGHWYPVAEPRGWALLLHMMPATKESYGKLAEELQRRNIAALAIDFRGHGESEGGPNGYERFPDTEQQAKINDVWAAYNWLSTAAGPTNRRMIVGASIGANLALQALRDNPEGLSALVLLSPGLDYRGIKTGDIARAIAARPDAGVPVLLAAGGADDDYSTQTVQTLAELLGDRATVRTFTRAGHGTTMLEREPAFLTEVADWIAAKVSNP